MTVVRHAGCLLLGAVVAVAAVAVHRSLFPAGLVLALLATFAPAWWLLLSSVPRGAATYVVGWLLVVGLVVVGRPEGDYALASDLGGYVLLGSGVALVPVGVLALAGRRRPRG